MYIGGCFPWGVNLTILLHMLPRLRMRGAILHFPLRLHGVVIGKVQGQLYLYLTST